MNDHESCIMDASLQRISNPVAALCTELRMHVEQYAYEYRTVP